MHCYYDRLDGNKFDMQSLKNNKTNIIHHQTNLLAKGENGLWLFYLGNIHIHSQVLLLTLWAIYEMQCFRPLAINKMTYERTVFLSEISTAFPQISATILPVLYNRESTSI